MTSDNNRARSNGGAPWAGGRFSSAIRCVLANNPSALTFMGTNTWILEDHANGTCVVVDPGPDDFDHISAVIRSCTELNMRVIAILLTHDHYDHSEGARRLARITGAPIHSKVLGNLELGPWQTEGFQLAVEVVPLAGHSWDSVGFLIEDESVLLTGDLSFINSTSVISVRTMGNLGDLLTTFDRVHEMASSGKVSVILPGHDAPIHDISSHISHQKNRRLARHKAIMDAIGAGAEASEEALVELLYKGLPKDLLKAARATVSSHLEYARLKSIAQQEGEDTL